jgi:hypothetical protein
MREQATMREEARQPTCHLASRWRRGELTEAEAMATTAGQVFLKHMRAIGRYPKSQQSAFARGARSPSRVWDHARTGTRPNTNPGSRNVFPVKTTMQFNP